MARYIGFCGPKISKPTRGACLSRHEVEVRLHRVAWMALAAIIALARCAAGEAVGPTPSYADRGAPVIPPALTWPTLSPTPRAPGLPRVPLPLPTLELQVTAAGQGYVLDELLPFIHATEAAYGLPRGIIAAMAIWESSGGVNRCDYNLTGYASCTVSFSSFEEGIEVTASTLAGYWPEDTRRKLCIWVSGQPCTTAHGRAYADRVIATMARFQ